MRGKRGEGGGRGIIPCRTPLTWVIESVRAWWSSTVPIPMALFAAVATVASFLFLLVIWVIGILSSPLFRSVIVRELLYQYLWGHSRAVWSKNLSSVLTQQLVYSVFPVYTVPIWGWHFVDGSELRFQILQESLNSKEIVTFSRKASAAVPCTDKPLNKSRKSLFTFLCTLNHLWKVITVLHARHNGLFCYVSKPGSHRCGWRPLTTIFRFREFELTLVSNSYS